MAKKENKTKMMLIIGGAVLLAGGAVAFFMLRPKKKDKELDEATPEATPEPEVDPTKEGWIKHLQGWVNNYTKNWRLDEDLTPEKRAQLQKADAVYQTYNQWKKAGKLTLPGTTEAVMFDEAKYDKWEKLRDYFVDSGIYDEVQAQVAQ